MDYGVPLILQDEGCHGWGGQSPEAPWRILGARQFHSRNVLQFVPVGVLLMFYCRPFRTTDSWLFILFFLSPCQRVGLAKNRAPKTEPKAGARMPATSARQSDSSLQRQRGPLGPRQKMAPPTWGPSNRVDRFNCVAVNICVCGFLLCFA